MISVLLVEDHANVTYAIAGLLNTLGDYCLASSAASAEEALAKLPRLSVDLALVDLALPGMNGIELIARLSRLYPELPCIVLTAHREWSYVKRALEAGARGYILKEDPLDIAEGIKQVLAGGTYLSVDLRPML